MFAQQQHHQKQTTKTNKNKTLNKQAHELPF
ncbi:hypothetical protein VIS19158_01564 [Vibrio scophthalmi LMG 19158]|uniref:Uncharacterized protein n=1 Tax=Vibrio scophthalmi LMG 19158 TaxID=870967 RepID=F9RPT7_9VIBR|nr:hypothetical protein VIS19158_01564 [Vibrio scophthalmi LMG 19158]